MKIKEIFFNFKKKILNENSILFIKNTFIYEFLNRNKVKKIIELIKKNNDKKIFLIGTPNYANIGDLAIAHAQIEFLKKKYSDNEIIEINDKEFFMMKRILKNLINRNDIIYLQGGGNFGNEYPITEFQRQFIVDNFDNEIICFPQTFNLNLSNEKKLNKYLKRANKIYSKKNFKLILREKNSIERLKKYLPNINYLYLPDIVLTLNNSKLNLKTDSDRNIENKNSKELKVLTIFRSDFEKTITNDFVDNIKEKLVNVFGENIKIDSTDTMCTKEELDNVKREDIFKNKLRQISNSDLVITDRLHGMIFSELALVPVIAFNNHSKKVEGVYKWIEDLSYVRFANNINEFENCLLELKKNINKISKETIKKEQENVSEKFLEKFMENL